MLLLELSILSSGYIAEFLHKITNGLLEGVNKKIRTVKRQAFCFMDMEYFKLWLYNLHASRYAFLVMNQTATNGQSTLIENDILRP
jgi:hypothetical protein